MNPRTPLLALTTLTTLALGALALSLNAQVTELEGQVAELEAQLSERREAPRSRRGGPSPKRSQERVGGSLSEAPERRGGPARRPEVEDSGLPPEQRQRFLEQAEEKLRAEQLAEQRERFEERAADIDEAVLGFAEDHELSEALTEELLGLFEANREDMEALFSLVEAGELDRRGAREEMFALREDTREAVKEMLGDEAAEDLGERLRPGRR